MTLFIDWFKEHYPDVPPHKTKVTYHRDNRKQYQDAYRDPTMFIDYVSEQKQNVFNMEHTQYVIVTVGTRNNTGRFVGVYEVTGEHQAPSSEWGKYHYILKEVSPVKPLGSKKPIISRVGRYFSNYFDRYMDTIKIVDWSAPQQLPEYQTGSKVILDYEQVRNIVEYPELNPTWVACLKQRGVYLLTSLVDGSQYVGSASAEEDGILQRWSDYIQTGHGNNLALAEAEIERYRFSVLEFTKASMTRKEIINREREYKEMLGTRLFGLNLN